MKFSTLAALMLSVAASALVASGGAAFTSKEARKVISETASPAERSDLITTAAAGFTRVGEGEIAILIAAESPPLTQAQVLLNVIDALPVSRRTEVDALMLKVEVAHALTTDWHHTRISRALAFTQARLGRLELAQKIAQGIADAEDRAFAQLSVVRALVAAGELNRAEQLALSMEENRRYGTYRQKAEALSAVAIAHHHQGACDGASQLIQTAAQLLPKKPGWSDGEAMRTVAIATHALGEIDAAQVWLGQAETLADAIKGPWRVSELTAVAGAWVACNQTARSEIVLKNVGVFLASLPADERVREAPTLARAYHAVGEQAAARAILTANLSLAATLPQPEVSRAARIRTWVAWTELFGAEPIPAAVAN